jgi:SAM-dependent methyltransferase
VPESVPCGMCGSSDLEPQVAKGRLLRLPAPYEVKQCRSCDFAMLSPRPTREELVAGYNTSPFWQPERMALFPTRRAFDARRLARLERHTGGPEELLVMACLDGGYFLENARKRGWRTLGVEFIDTLVDRVTDQGFEIARSPLWDLGVVNGRTFDAIYTHSLEHVPDVTATLASYHALLRPDGILMMEVPNQFDALKERLKEALWPLLGEKLIPFLKSDAPPEVHVSYFTPTTVRQVLERHGFEVLESRTYMPWNPVYHFERRGRMVREMIYLVGGLFGRGPSTEVIARRLPAAAGAIGP